MMRLVVLLACGLGWTAAVAAQDIRDFFPHGVGDRWVYEVEGVHVVRDTVDSIVEWTVLDTRSSAEVDTVWFEVNRRDASGETSTEVCVVEVGLPIALVKFSDPYPTLSNLCRTPGAMPLGPSGGSSYPFLFFGDSLGVQTLGVGTQEYTAEMASASFLNSNTYPRPWEVWSTEVRSTLAAGIGQVSLFATYTHHRNSVFLERDTLRARLIGADVGGALYGNIQPVASDEVASSNTLAIRVGPNPAGEFVMVWVSRDRHEQDIELAISDVLGRVVVKTRTRAGEPIRLDVSALPPGLYIVSAETNRQRVQTRLVVQR